MIVFKINNFLEIYKHFEAIFDERLICAAGDKRHTSGFLKTSKEIILTKDVARV